MTVIKRRSRFARFAHPRQLYSIAGDRQARSRVERQSVRGSNSARERPRQQFPFLKGAAVVGVVLGRLCQRQENHRTRWPFTDPLL